MKRSFMARAAGLAIVTLLAAGALIPAGHAQIIVGTGANSSYLLIEGFATALVYEYRYDSPAPPFDSYALLTAVDQAAADLDLSIINFGTLESPNYFLAAITYGGVTHTNTAFPDIGPFWAQWVSGGQAGFPEAGAVPSGSWTFGSGLSAPYRYVEPGSWDGFIFNLGSTAPSILPVPEPGTFALFAGGCGILLIVFRKRR